ncbi:MAG: acetate/propionate family kinase [Candidatus Woesearchaeota archaeon]
MNINPEHYFVLNGGKIIKDLNELVEELKVMDKKTFEYHVNDSKNDFANWIAHVFKARKLAESISGTGYQDISMIRKLILKHLNELKILIVNGGSSSLKFQIIEFHSKTILVKGNIDAIGLDRCSINIKFNNEEISKNVNVKNATEAANVVIQNLLEKDIIGDLCEIRAVGHRVVHGAENHRTPVIIDDSVLVELNELSELAPLHNPVNISYITAFMKLFNCPHVAVFDTAFHSTISKEKFLYALPYEYYENNKIRKYGFHGSSHKYVSGIITDYYKIKGKKNPKIIICHLGNGCSITAIKNNKSFNTSMGFTPLDGVIMGTRCGDLDPAIALHLEKTLNLGYQEVSVILNKKSGLVGISGKSDMRELYKTSKEPKSKLAMNMFSDRIIHYIGAYAAELNGVDAIVFTAGIGENAFYIRKAVLDNFKYLGLILNDSQNKKNEFIISDKKSKIEVFVVPTNEELQIAIETKKILKL